MADECQRSHWQGGHKLSCTADIDPPRPSRTIASSASPCFREEPEPTHAPARLSTPVTLPASCEENGQTFINVPDPRSATQASLGPGWMPRECIVCGGSQPESEEGMHAAILTFRRCARCKVAVYCSDSCQRLHWRNSHRSECRAPRFVSVVPTLVASASQPAPLGAGAPGTQEQRESKTEQEQRRENQKWMNSQVIRIQYDPGAIGFEGSNKLDPKITGSAS